MVGGPEATLAAARPILEALEYIYLPRRANWVWSDHQGLQQPGRGGVHAG